MRTITVTYLDGTPDLVIDADSWDTDTDDMFVFRADGRLVALVPSRNVRHIVSDATHEDKVREAVEQTVIAPDDAIEREKVRKLRAALRLPVSSERVYDASVVSAECSTIRVRFADTHHSGGPGGLGSHRFRYRCHSGVRCGCGPRVRVRDGWRDSEGWHLH